MARIESTFFFICSHIKKGAMKMDIRIGIAGFGNLGKAALYEARRTPDMTPVCVITRRDPSFVGKDEDGVTFIRSDDALSMREKVDVLLICGSSAYDLPRQTPSFARDFCVVDAFDTHRKIDEHFSSVDLAARQSEHSAVIAAGWDPGLFSLWRLFARAAMPDGAVNTFWGPGVSQGHSDAIRHIEGVTDAVQYTIPQGEFVSRSAKGDPTAFTDSERIRRLCYVSVKKSADRDKIAKEISSMPHYFKEYDTAVFFVSEEELAKKHYSLAHQGQVFCSDADKNSIACSLKTPSNPNLTARLMLACARAAYRLYSKKEYGCFTMFDIPPALLLPEGKKELRKAFL